MNRSTPGLPVHPQLPESTQTHVHWVSDTIQPSHPLLSPSPPALHFSQHQGLFQWVSSSHQVARVLEFQLQYLSFQWIIPLHIAIVIYSSHRLCMGMNTYVSFKTNHYICVIKAWLHFWSVGADSCRAPLLPCIWASSLVWFQCWKHKSHMSAPSPQFYPWIAIKYNPVPFPCSLEPLKVFF